MDILPSQKTIWLHGPSVGELDQVRAFASVVKQKDPSLQVYVSYYSDSVLDKHLQDPNFDFCFRLPFDLPNAYELILKKWRPLFLCIFAWDTWPNLVKSCHESSIDVYLASATLSESSSRLKGLSLLLTKKTFSYFTAIYPTNEILTPLFSNIAPRGTEIQALGDTRIDTILAKLEKGKPGKSFSQVIQQFSDSFRNKNLVCFGSTYPSCEEKILSSLSQIPEEEIQNKSFWVFPHKWEEIRMSEFSAKLQRYGLVKRFSELKTLVSGKLPQFVLVDEMGILAFAYQYARFAYVGGGFHHRIHNTLEPAAFGLALFTGPKITNASEAIIMQRLGGLKVVHSNLEFTDTLRNFLNSDERSTSLGQKNKQFVLDNRGASERLYAKVFSAHD
ncbi:3-deoxy-D-manno-octulosonic-acid transferase [Leptospira ryugenii]|uniref:3-deoxy-D-manno-octulosonic acid transferase n=1 Tax=Leptospira ryugenii TaxID=1917863 RepID=A0A2P2DY67_9LEPT|nr:glycosyltransferase N-terminal domain-containing protein [Leptospira ryugenii]GBF49585.1 3-deoxy-D-manno-octulosonic-acid transferase [Leptospira ryugenii]